MAIVILAGLAKPCGSGGKGPAGDVLF